MEDSHKQANSSYGKKGFTLIDRLTIRERLKFAIHAIENFQSINVDKVPTILELGCGYSGENLRVLAKKFPGATFIGLDLSVTKYKLPPNITLLALDVDHEIFQHEVDVVLSLAVVEHLINPLNHFSFLASVCDPNGVIGITTPTPQLHLLWSILKKVGLIQGEQDHLLYLTREGIHSLARKAGLRTVAYKSFEMGLNQFCLLQPE